jgi:type I restriction enzyme S subunit
MEGWTIEKFSNVVVYTKKPKGLKVSYPIPFVAMDLVPLDKMEINSFKLIDKVKSGNYVEDGDILLAKITPSFENGKQGILTIGKKYAYATTEVIPFKGKDNFADTLYLAYYLKKDDVRIELAEKMEGSTGRQRLSKSVLDNLPIPLPPLPEQRKISHVLSTIQKAIEQQDKLIRTTTELKKALMQKLFTEGTKGEPQRKTEIGLVPESWEVVELGKHSNIRTSFPTFHKLMAKYKSVRQGTEFFFLKVSDMNIAGNEIFIYESNNKFLTDKQTDFTNGFIKPNSLIFPKRGAAISTNKKRITTKYSVLDPNLIGVEPNSNIDAKFLYNYFEMFDLSSLQDNNVIPQLNKHNVAGVKFPLPSIEEQKIIVKDIKIIENKIKFIEKNKQTLNDLFKTLLHELMTGQRRVHELEFEKMEDFNTL